MHDSKIKTPAENKKTEQEKKKKHTQQCMQKNTYIYDTYICITATQQSMLVYQGYDKVVDEHDGGLAEQEGGQDSASEAHHVGHHQGLRPEEVLAAVLLHLPHLNIQ